MPKSLNGIKFHEEDKIVVYELRTKLGTATKIRINTDNYSKKTLNYVKPGDKDFDKLMCADIHEVNRFVYTNDTIEEAIHGRMSIEVAYSIGNGAIKRMQLFYGALKSRTAKSLTLEA